MTKTKKICHSYIPQSNYRSQQDKEFIEIDTNITPIGTKNPYKNAITEKIKVIIAVIHTVITMKPLKSSELLKRIVSATFKSTKKSIKKTVEDEWNSIKMPIINTIKVHYLNQYSTQLLTTFEQKINFLTNKYKRYLPTHISVAEGDDLFTIAQIELIETFKAWDPEHSENLWPLAYSRINGAMKDHIRYITKTDPSRFYDWVIEAAHLYSSINDSTAIRSNIENGADLSKALTPHKREQLIVTMHINKDLTFSKIAQKIKLSESQISRIYNGAVKKLKTILNQ